MTVRRLMVVVALLGIGFGFPLGVFRILTRCQQNALIHKRAFMDVNEKRHRLVREKGLHQPDVPRLNRLARYHIGMLRKWEQAAPHPWFPIEPDPPQPD
jgi:hypothetical protein